MKTMFDPSIPIYTQIVEMFRREICSGQRAPGMRVEPVRELAATLGVNPNTLQRALGELEREGLLYTERTAGRFVTQDTERIAESRRMLSQGLVEEFVAKMQALGCPLSEMLELVEKKAKGEHDHANDC